MISGTVRTREIDVTQEQLDDYYIHEKPLQDAFPHLSEEDREFIQTGMTEMTQEEWEDLEPHPATREHARDPHHFESCALCQAAFQGEQEEALAEKRAARRMAAQLNRISSEEQ